MKQGVASALDRLTEFMPDLRYAVVFDSQHWHPRQPPSGSEWDYEPFASEHMARAAFADVRPGESEPELWQLQDDGWQQVA